MRSERVRGIGTWRGSGVDVAVAVVVTVEVVGLVAAGGAVVVVVRVAAVVLAAVATQCSLSSADVPGLRISQVLQDIPKQYLSTRPESQLSSPAGHM